jgi:bacterioferritin
MHDKSIDILNRVVRDELAAVHQYMYFHFHCDDQGYDLLASLFKKTAIEEMIHVERAAERILFLEGDVDMKTAEDAQPIRDVGEMLARAAQMEKESAEEYNRWANEVGADNDSATKRLLESLVDDEERHYDQYTQEIDNLKRFGEKYLALQSIERSKGYSGGEG